MFHRSARLIVTIVISSLSPIGLAHAHTLKSGAAVPRPIVFVPNHGQAPADVLWQAFGQGFEAWFRSDGFDLRIAGAKTKPNLSLVGIDKKSTVDPLDPQPGKINFFHGSDPGRWVRGLPT